MCLKIVDTFLSKMTAYSALTFPSKRKITEEQDCRGGMMKNLCSVTIGQVYDTFFLG